MKFRCSERMRSHQLIVVSLVVVLITVECACGGGTEASTPPPPPPKSAIPNPTVLRTLYRVLVSGTDRMTTVGPNERSSYPLEAQVYYVPDQSASSRTVLNRVVNSSGNDHADTVTSLSGYSQDMELGFPWSNASASGVAPLAEAFNAETGDYALLAPSETLDGYVSAPLAAYGYPRYGKAPEVLRPQVRSTVLRESVCPPKSGTQFAHRIRKKCRSNFRIATNHHCCTDCAIVRV
jgi:hypothetical protein